MFFYLCKVLYAASSPAPFLLVIRVGMLRMGRKILLGFWSNLNSKLVMIKEASREGDTEEGRFRLNSGEGIS